MFKTRPYIPRAVIIYYNKNTPMHRYISISKIIRISSYIMFKTRPYIPRSVIIYYFKKRQNRKFAGAVCTYEIFQVPGGPCGASGYRRRTPPPNRKFAGTSHLVRQASSESTHAGYDIASGSTGVEREHHKQLQYSVWIDRRRARAPPDG